MWTPTARRTVEGADGLTWTVGVRWLPRRPKRLRLGRRRRRPEASTERPTRWYDRLDFPADLPDDLVVLVVLVVVALVMWFLVIPLAIFLLDVLVVLVLTVVSIAARVLLRRPWVVEAKAGTVVRRWLVVGHRASRRRVDEVAHAIASGAALPDGAVTG